MPDDTLAPVDAGDAAAEAAAWAELERRDNAEAEPLEPAPAPPEEETPADPPKVEEPEPAQPPVDDPWAAVPEPLRADRAKLLAERDSLKKAEASFQRRIRQQHEEIVRLKSTPATLAEPAEDAVKSRQDRLAKLRDEYPEVAEPVLAELDELRQKVDGIASGVSAIHAGSRESFLIQQQDQLTQQHPDWLELVHKPDFKPWLERQPRHVREAMQRNSEFIEDAEEAGDVVGRFEAYLEQQSGQANGQTQMAPATQPMSQKRRLQREGATTLSSRSPAVASGIPEDGDESEIWKALDRRDEQRARASR